MVSVICLVKTEGDITDASPGDLSAQIAAGCCVDVDGYILTYSAIDTRDSERIGLPLVAKHR